MYVIYLNNNNGRLLLQVQGSLGTEYSINFVWSGTLRSQKCNSNFTFLISDFVHAAVAQLVEQLIRNQQVTGSSPVGGSGSSLNFKA